MNDSTDARPNTAKTGDTSAELTARLATVFGLLIIGGMLAFVNVVDWSAPFLIVVGILAGLIVLLNVLARFGR